LHFFIQLVIFIWDNIFYMVNNTKKIPRDAHFYPHHKKQQQKQQQLW